MVCKMRASFLIIGPLLARFGEAKVSLPGGCAIGVRPIDIHLDAFKKMGAKVNITEGYVKISVAGKLQGKEINLKFPSVGATQNIMMAATLAHGETIIKNAAQELEIIDLANCLNEMGAIISGAGSNKIKIIGIKKLNAACHTIMSDRIEAGTYAIAAAITNGCLKIKNANISLFQGFDKELTSAGVKIKTLNNNEIEVTRHHEGLKPVNISTAPFPKFPTDMQAQFMALMLFASGDSVIKENIFENRFMHIMELCRMGAEITYDKNIAIVRPSKNIKGTQVMATDLRASVSLVLTALTIKNTTIINRIYHLERGYERLVEKLNKCGASIEVSYN